MMKKLIFVLLIGIAAYSCKNNGNGELIGVQNRGKFFQPDPYGMAYVPMGSYAQGAGEEDAFYSFQNMPRTITVSAFYMDETEITNNEYRQFVYYVRDSIARTLLGEINPEEFLISENKKTGEIYDPPYLNWETKIDLRNQEVVEALEPLYVPENERYFRKKEIDARKLFYEYYFVDLLAASKKNFKETSDPKNANFANRHQGMRDRSVYVRKEVINVYPDTLSWLHDYSYSYNDPIAKMYFSHPGYDHYPVVGVSWKQANAFCVWRTRLLETGMKNRKKGAMPAEFRLPTEAEWEWAARGGNTFSPYPWGGPYTRNDKGCFLANFKPLRGNYVDDGGARTIIVAHYPANDFGLYDMAGNVAEWCVDAYDESATQFTWDMNPTYQYNAKEDDPAILKRKVIRGGSWKDIAYYLQVNTRSYEYQDSAKCYIGFRCVQDFIGRQKNDNPAKASRIY
ncbi:MAG: SUMF1/EgtB/PvdO family nonheme iron enzyme [Lentimicrobiaceae bacterium]|nr:SUMF1/EgtB/PvdO family nonheme iron enzyme [Lentimicrobiaceae bacterium]